LKKQKTKTRIKRIRVWDSDRLKKLSDEEFIDAFVFATEERTDLKDGDLVIERKLKNRAPAGSVELCLNEARRRQIPLDVVAKKIADRAVDGNSFIGTLIKTKKWKRFEIMAAKAVRVWLEAGGIKIDKVDFDARIQGRITRSPRQIDIWLEKYSPRHVVAVECKDHFSSISVDKIEAFHSKLEDVGADKGIIIAKSGFQQGAMAAADNYGIILMTFNLVDKTNPPAELNAKQISDLRSMKGDMWRLRHNDSAWYFAADYLGTTG
jgi:hypothetical protein